MTSHLDSIYPRHWAETWDRVGLVTGRPDGPADHVHLAVDLTPAVLAEAVDLGATMIVTHHPLFLRGVSSLDPLADYKGEIVHTLIEKRMGLYTAHTNADVADPGVSDALAARLGVTDLAPLQPLSGEEHEGTGRGIGRVGRLPEPMTLAEFARHAAASLPATTWGVRVAGDPGRQVSSVAVSGGAGDSYLKNAAAAGVDVYLTADLRHHPASEFTENGGPALADAAHWATERPWLDTLAAQLSDVAETVTLSDIPTDPWTIHAEADHQ
ncbi:Nif3-like dinuclear metal center hexameric protein [Salininema proteolyticum]|uniref:GTP cyclohydrolase 1 type 2 homolog n=1 Tax=Salininema proteolyticum TaxID=1607685 RepID=A0ABV8U1N5_9ACTN